MKKFLVRFILILLLAGVIAALVCFLARGCSKKGSENEGWEPSETFTGYDESTELPRSFSIEELGIVPYAKSQGDLGACWAFASMTALEFSLAPGETWDFSEDHMIWNNAYYTGKEGGDFLMAMSYLTSWRGPVREADDPYNDGGTDNSIPPVKHVQEVRFLPARDFAAIKRAVYANRAVESSVYIELDETGFQVDPSCYNSETFAYLYNSGDIPNHEVVIIGWDDDFPAEYFGGKASAPGAFICMNSWGREFGNNGLFYVSYEDTVIGRTALAYSLVENPDNYDNIYQFDNAGWTGSIGYNQSKAYMANVYTAKSNEALRAVGFYATGPDTTYKVYICRNFEGQESLDVNGQVYAAGRMQYAGYYTVNLERAVELLPQERFAVIVEIETEGGEKPVAIEVGNEYVEPMLEGRESYLSHGGTQWECVQAEGRGNICLKVYTDNVTPIAE